MKQHTCFYCYTKFHTWQAPYQCGAPKTICSPVADVPFDHFFGDPTPRGRLKEITLKEWGQMKAGTKADIRCDTCASLVREQVCPTCHGPLPEGFFKSILKTILLVGETRDETALYQRSLAAKLDQMTAGLLGYTVSLLPFDRGFLLQKESSSILVSLIRTTWEHLENGRMNVPSPIAGVLVAIKDRILEKDFSTAILPHLRRLSLGYKNTPLGLILTHMEGWQSYFPSGSSLWRLAAHNDAYDTLDGLRVTGELEAAFGYWYGINSLKTIQDQFKTTRFFGVSSKTSALGRVPGYFRVEDPLLWLLDIK